MCFLVDYAGIFLALYISISISATHCMQTCIVYKAWHLTCMSHSTLLSCSVCMLDQQNTFYYTKQWQLTSLEPTHWRFQQTCLLFRWKVIKIYKELFSTFAITWSIFCHSHLQSEFICIFSLWEHLDLIQTWLMYWFIPLFLKDCSIGWIHFSKSHIKLAESCDSDMHIFIDFLILLSFSTKIIAMFCNKE